VSIPRKPDLDQLIRALTADARPDELAGRDAARTAFRAAGQGDAASQAARRRPGARFRRPSAGLPRRRMAAISAAGLIAVAGLTAAAYAQALPGPVQQVAHTVFAPLGMPDSRLRPARPGPAAVTVATPGGKSGRASGTSPETPSPRPGDDFVLTLTASRARVPAGAVVELGGRVTDRGRGAAGARVRLLERLAGSATWDLVATGVTGPRGAFRLPSPPLTTSAVFRVLGPDNRHSDPVRVTVVSGNLRAPAAGDAPAPAPAASSGNAG
jgi:hypothetical protein